MSEADPGFSFGEDLSKVGLLAAIVYLRDYNGLGGAWKDNGMQMALTCCKIDASLAPAFDDLLEAFFAAVKKSHGSLFRSGGDGRSSDFQGSPSVPR